MTSTRAMLAAGGLAIATSVASGAGQFYQVGLGAGLTEGISGNGVAAGSFSVPGNQYMMWTVDGGPMNIGGVAAGNGVGGQAKVSLDGGFISGTVFNDTSGFHEAGRYDVNSGTWMPLGGIGGSSGTEISSGWGISGDGNSVVGLAWAPGGGPGTGRAFRWTEGAGMTDLGSTVPGRSSRANGIDHDGDVVVGWQDQDNGFRQGAVWVDGVQQLITKPGGSAALEAFDVSADGKYATGLGIGSFVVPGESYRFNTETGTSEIIPNLAVGGQRNMAGTAISGDGSTIVGGTWPIGPATFGTAIIWQEGIGTTRFDDYLDSLNVDYPANFNFAFVSDMSPDGTWFTGWGNEGSPATTQAWVIQIPSPAGASLLALCGLTGLRRRR